MKKISLTLYIFVLAILVGHAQDVNPDSIKQLKKRFAFANMYFGLEGFSTLNGSAPILNQDNTTSSTNFKGYTVPRLVWGGTHFWGYADIYVAFPLGGYKKPVPTGLDAMDFNLGVETAFKIYPSKLRTNSIRPYVGWAWNIGSYSQQQTGKLSSISLQKNATPILLGLSFRGPRTIFEVGMQYFYKNKYEYPVSPTVNGTLQTPKLAFTVGAKYLLETTYQKGSYIKKRIEVLEKHKKFNAFYVGIGPSGTTGARTFSEYDQANYPFFKQHTRYFGIIPDITAGYYFAKPEINVGISYRRMKDGYQGFGVQHYHQRTSFMLEAYHFLFDYHGFLPYIGVTLSKENLFFANKIGQNDWTRYSGSKLAAGVIFGWDIRPTKAESWLLRTNLRYAPVSLKVENKKVSFDYLEFNFIQLVLFPERILAQRKERNK